jgi:hypothetical protein
LAASEQREPLGHSPQLPPQPSEPQFFQEQAGVQSGGRGFRFFSFRFLFRFFAPMSARASRPIASPSAAPNRRVIALRRSIAAVDNRLLSVSKVPSSMPSPLSSIPSVDTQIRCPSREMDIVRNAWARGSGYVGLA